MTTWTYTRQGELYHHGIKGQKWGVRRFQNKDGSLTPAGRRRYDEPNVGRKTSESVTIDGQTFKVYGRNNKQYADKVAKKAKDMGATVSRESKTKAAKIKEAKKYKIPENKSLHRLKLEEKYMKQGMSRSEAEQKAAKRIKAEAYVAGAAALTVASCVAYTKYKGYTTDKVFKADSEFQRIMRLADNAEIKDGRQYLAFDKRDKVKYKGMLGNTFKSAIERENQVNKYADLDPITDKIYDVTVKNKNEIRVASEKKAREVFAQLNKDDMQFEIGVRRAIKNNGMLYTQMNPKLVKLVDKIEKGGKISPLEMKRSGYDLFNIMLMDKSEQGIKNANKFYDAIRKTGANAIIDVNDRKYSGYKSKMPIITLDDGFEYSKRVMSNEEIQKNMNKATIDIIAPEIMKSAALMTAYYAATPVMNNAQVSKRVLQYKEQHPNTNLSDAEIRSMVKEQMEKEKEEW